MLPGSPSCGWGSASSIQAVNIITFTFVLVTFGALNVWYTSFPRASVKQKPFEPSAVDFEYLQLVRDFHFLTVEHVMRLRGVSSKPKVQTRLLHLYTTKYLDRRSLPHVGVGNTEFIYALSTKGIILLKALVFSDFSRFTPEE